MYNASVDDLDNILEADLVLYQGLYLEAQMSTVLEDYGFAVTRHFTDNDLIKGPKELGEIDPH